MRRFYHDSSGVHADLSRCPESKELYQALRERFCAPVVVAGRGSALPDVVEEIARMG